MAVAGAHARALAAAGAALGAANTWRALRPAPPGAVGAACAGGGGAVTAAPGAASRPVPMLLRDPLALLMHLLLLAPHTAPYLDIR